MSLPLSPPLKPQLALSRKELPTGEEYSYEVKLDGFRCLAFVDGEETFLQSRGGKPFGRYFPELALPRGRYVLDGEIVVRGADGREDFDALGQRIHPAASRVERLSVRDARPLRGLRPARPSRRVPAGASLLRASRGAREAAWRATSSPLRRSI